MTIADRLIRRAQRTPYYHLKGYMNRWWLVPYAGEKKGSPTPQFQFEWREQGCGTVKWYRRPIARVLQAFGIAIRVHEILRSDHGCFRHNHPWPYIAFILKGGYYEETKDKMNEDSFQMLDGTWHTWYGPGSILRRDCENFHKIILAPGKRTTFTLFIMIGDKVNTWGFDTPHGFVPHYDYQGDV